MQSKTITPPTNKTIVATVASVMTVSALQAGGIPAIEMLAIGAGAVFIGIVVGRQFTQQNQAGEYQPVTYEPAAVEQPIDYSSISIRVYEKMLAAMDSAGTNNHEQLHAIAENAYESLGLPYQLAENFALVAVIRWCIKHGCVPSPLPTEWEKYRNMINQCFEHVTYVSSHVSESAKDVLRSGGDVSEKGAENVSNVIKLSEAASMVAAMAALKGELGDKAKDAYSLYGYWCKCLSSDLLRVRGGRDWLKNTDSTLTVKQADALLKVFKLKAVRAGLLLPNPEYKGKPPYTEYLIANHTTTANTTTAGE